MGKMRSQREADKIANTLNKRYELTNLNDCPRCENGYDETGNYVFDGSTVSFFQECRDCGIRVTHHFDWKESEVELLDKPNVTEGRQYPDLATKVRNMDPDKLRKIVRKAIHKGKGRELEGQ